MNGENRSAACHTRAAAHRMLRNGVSIEHPGPTTMTATMIRPIQTAAFETYRRRRCEHFLHASGMTVTDAGTVSTMWSDSTIADKDCRAVLYPAGATAYSGTGWTAMAGQDLGGG